MEKVSSLGLLLRLWFLIWSILRILQSPYSFCVAGGDEWKLVAERLGLDQEKIRFLDNRTLNPADILIGYIANQRHLTVADLYEVLCDCELPVIADTL